MRSHPGSFDLSFMLPRLAPGRCYAGVVRGVAQSENGCSIDIEVPLIRICGPSRERVFEAATALLRDAGLREPAVIGAVLHTPSRPSGFDRWHIVVGADVSFSATGIDPWLPVVRDRDRIVVPGMPVA